MCDIVNKCTYTRLTFLCRLLVKDLLHLVTAFFSLKKCFYSDHFSCTSPYICLSLMLWTIWLKNFSFDLSSSFFTFWVTIGQVGPIQWLRISSCLSLCVCVEVSLCFIRRMISWHSIGEMFWNPFNYFLMFTSFFIISKMIFPFSATFFPMIPSSRVPFKFIVTTKIDICVTTFPHM